MVLVVAWHAVGGVSGARGGSLPALHRRPWHGYFIAHEQRAYQFGLGCDGEGIIRIMRSRRESFGRAKELGVVFTIEELLPDGRIVTKRIDPESLESADEATTEPRVIRYRGRVTGDAAFEVVAGFDGARMEFGGRVVDPGELEHPLRFVARISMRVPYPDDDPSDREFRRKVRGDEMRFETIDGREGRIEMAGTADVAGQAYRRLRLGLAAYDRRRFEFAATDGSRLEIEPRSGRSLLGGMVIRWRPEPERDPEGAGRLVIEIR